MHGDYIILFRQPGSNAIGMEYQSQRYLADEVYNRLVASGLSVWLAVIDRQHTAPIISTTESHDE